MYRWSKTYLLFGCVVPVSSTLDVVVDVSIEDPDMLLLITLSPLPLPRSSSSRLQRLCEVGIVAQYESESAVPFGVVDAEFGAVANHPFVQPLQQQTVRIGEQRVHHKVVQACICWRTHCKQLQITFTAANGKTILWNDSQILQLMEDNPRIPEITRLIQLIGDVKITGQSIYHTRNQKLLLANHRTIDLSHEEPKTVTGEFRFAGFIYTESDHRPVTRVLKPIPTPAMRFNRNWRACPTVIVIYNIIISHWWRKNCLFRARSGWQNLTFPKHYVAGPYRSTRFWRGTYLKPCGNAGGKVDTLVGDEQHTLAGCAWDSNSDPVWSAWGKIDSKDDAKQLKVLARATIGHPWSTGPELL